MCVLFYGETHTILGPDSISIHNAQGDILKSMCLCVIRHIKMSVWIVYVNGLTKYSHNQANLLKLSLVQGIWDLFEVLSLC